MAATRPAHPSVASGHADSAAFQFRLPSCLACVAPLLCKNSETLFYVLLNYLKFIQYNLDYVTAV